MSTGLALARLYGIEADTGHAARIGQKAEHLYAGCKCGPFRSDHQLRPARPVGW